MVWGRLTSIRGQLVLWYLGVLAVLLLALGVFQTVTLRSYLISSTAYTLRHGVYQQLAVLGPCYVQSPNDLRTDAQTLALLLGGHDTAVSIVTASGQSLASHGLGPAGAIRPMHVSTAAVQQLIGRAAPSPSVSQRVVDAECANPGSAPPRRHRGPPRFSQWTGSLPGGGDMLLVAVPLGPPGDVVGYAIVGRSLQGANAIVGHALLVFGLGALIALLIAALVALPIINRALRPLRRVAGTAEIIAAGNLEQRANIPHTHDEIGRLGEAFDTMVDRLQSAISTASASEERMRRFLADASHELRTPVTVLRGASQVLLRQEAEGPMRLVAPLRDMHEEAIRLSRLVDDLLTLSRIDAGQHLAPQPVELRSFLQEFLERYASVWPNRTIELDDSRLDGAKAEVDPDVLRRVVTNLVDNAARYSGGGPITISGAPMERAVALTVVDEGPGLTPEDARKVFERFYRASKSRSRGSGGTGLGLAIVQGLIEQSGGSLAIDTAPDRGTTITFTLDRA